MPTALPSDASVKGFRKTMCPPKAAAASNPTDFETKLQLEGEEPSEADVEKPDSFGSDVRF